MHLPHQSILASPRFITAVLSLVGLCSASAAVGQRGTYFQHYVLRLFPVQERALPWHAVALLEEAANCILLQHVDGGYRFIHPLLQEHFASLDVKAVLEQETEQTKSSEDMPPQDRMT